MRLENRGGRSFVLGVLRFDNDNKMRPKADLVNVCLTVSQCCLEYSRTLTPLTVFEKVYKIFELGVAKSSFQTFKNAESGPGQSNVTL